MVFLAGQVQEQPLVQHSACKVSSLKISPNLRHQHQFYDISLRFGNSPRELFDVSVHMLTCAVAKVYCGNRKRCEQELRGQLSNLWQDITSLSPTETLELHCHTERKSVAVLTVVAGNISAM